MKICITLATYNGEKYLAQMLNALVAQTRPADIIIAIDDGSKDSTCKILEDYKSKLPLEITKFEENRGHRAAFSAALAKAQAMLNNDDIIFLADQDDIWNPNKLKTMSQKIGDYSLIFGDAEIIDSEGIVVENSWRNKMGIVEHLEQQALLTGYTNVTGCMTAFKAELLKTILPIPQDVPVHDQWITLCATVKNGYGAITDKVIRYRIHENNAIGEGHKKWSEKLQTNLQWAKAVRQSNLYERLSSQNQKFLDKFIQFLTLRFNHAFLSPLWLLWVMKNAQSLYPQVKKTSKMFARIIFSIVGVSTAQKFFHKN